MFGSPGATILVPSSKAAARAQRGARCRFSRIISGLAASLVLAAFVTPWAVPQATAQSVRADLNHEMTGTTADRALQRLAEAIAEQTGGDVQITVHSRGELGGEREMFDLMEVGGIEMGLSGAAIISAVAPEYGLLDMPYTITSPEHLHRVINSEIGEELRKTILERKGIRILAWMDRAPRHLTTQGRAVRTPGDMDGLKIRIREIPVQVQAFRMLGASPVPMAFGEVYTALQTGAIDAQENPLEIINGSSFYEVQDHLILTGHVREVQWLFASDTWWQTLSPEVQEIIEEAAEESMAWGQDSVYQADDRLLEELQDKGMKVIELTGEERALFQDALVELPEQFADTWQEGLFERIVKKANP